MTTSTANTTPAAPLLPVAAFMMRCARCGRELTDAASKECGVGPVCRKKDNAILARQIPSNPSEARRILDNRRRFVRVNDVRANNTLDLVIDAIRFEQERLDWRQTVKRIEWLLATGLVTGMMTEIMYEIVEALGYVALVSLWKGELAIGAKKPTELCFEEGLFTLTSVRPPRCVIDKIKSIRGRRYDGTTKAWTFPAQAAAELAEIVNRHFLAPQGVEEAVKGAKAHLERRRPQNTRPARPARRPLPVLPVLPPLPALPAFQVRFRPDGAAAKFNTPYNPTFISALKGAVVGCQREWDRQDKVWIVFGRENIARIQTLCTEHFGA